MKIKVQRSSLRNLITFFTKYTYDITDWIFSSVCKSCSYYNLRKPSSSLFYHFAKTFMEHLDAHQKQWNFRLLSFLYKAWYHVLEFPFSVHISPFLMIFPKWHECLPQYITFWNQQKPARIVQLFHISIFIVNQNLHRQVTMYSRK